MRAEVTVDKLRRFLEALGERARGPGSVYLTGGAVALLEGWRERSRFIAKHGPVSFYEYDPYGLALSKIARGLDRDLGDVRQLVERGLVEPAKFHDLYAAAAPQLVRYPRLDAGALQEKIDLALPRS